MSNNNMSDVRSLRERLNRKINDRDRLQHDIEKIREKISQRKRQIERGPAVAEYLEKFSEEILGREIRKFEEVVSTALKEVLDQKISLKAETTTKGNKLNIQFSIERNGASEDLKRGQGGSVQNIVSTILRVYVILKLDPVFHRRFIVMDEQDCWLSPNLIPRFFGIMRDLAKKLSFQLIVISHHEHRDLESYVDKIYYLSSDSDTGVKANLIHDSNSLTS